jgi:transcriptional regulator with XRE-family HTH domain
MERGLTLRQAAERTGVTKETLSELERALRDPHPPTLAKIAGGYGVEIPDLLGPMEGADAASSATSQEPVPLDEAPESGHAGVVPEWLAEWGTQDLQFAREDLDKECAQWEQALETGDLDLAAIEKFFEAGPSWADHLLSVAIGVEMRKLVESGRVRLALDPEDEDPSDDVYRLLATSELGKSWERYMDLFDRLLEVVRELEIDASVREHIEKEAEERRAQFTSIPGGLKSA